MKGIANITKMFKKQSFFVKCIIALLIVGLVVFIVPRLQLQQIPSFEGFSSITPAEVNYYYMDGCGHCEKFSPVWDEFTSAYKGSIQFQKFNMKDAEEDVKKYEVNGFPTVVVIDENGKFEQYEGERTIDGLQSHFGYTD